MTKKKELAYEQAERLILRYVKAHNGDPAAAAVNWSTLQPPSSRDGVTVPIARAAMWRLVALGRLKYSWDGMLSLPADVEILDGPQAHPEYPSVCMTCGETLIQQPDGKLVHADELMERHKLTTDQLLDQLRQIRDAANELIGQLTVEGWKA